MPTLRRSSLASTAPRGPSLRASAAHRVRLPVALPVAVQVVRLRQERGLLALRPMVHLQAVRPAWRAAPCARVGTARSFPAALSFRTTCHPGKTEVQAEALSGSQGAMIETLELAAVGPGSRGFAARPG